MVNNTIKITITNIDDYFKKHEKKVINHFYSRRKFLTLIIVFILGLLIILSTITDNLHPYLIGLGIGASITGLLRLLDFYRGKEATKLALNKKLPQLKKLNSNIEFVFNESYFSKNTKLSESKIQWEYFYTYKIDNNILHLFSDKLEAPISEYEIPLDSLNEVNKEALIELLKKITSNHKKTLDNK